MKNLIVLSAPPGSGKSTWAHVYEANHENTYIISSDEIRYELTNSRQDFSKQKEVWETFAQRIHEYANKGDDINVILDALCDLNSLRKKYVLDNPEYDRYILVLFPHTKEECFSNNVKRDEDLRVPRHAFDDLWNKFEEPTEEVLNMFDEIIEVTFSSNEKHIINNRRIIK